MRAIDCNGLMLRRGVEGGCVVRARDDGSATRLLCILDTLWWCEVTLWSELLRFERVVMLHLVRSRVIVVGL